MPEQFPQTVEFDLITQSYTPSQAREMLAHLQGPVQVELEYDNGRGGEDSIRTNTHIGTLTSTGVFRESYKKRGEKCTRVLNIPSHAAFSLIYRRIKITPR